MPKVVSEKADVLPALMEVFREHGFEGASLSLIGRHTGLGKGSLYHFFPGGKEEMAATVLAEISSWFEREIFAPLRDHDDPHQALDAMFTNTSAYFASGKRVCLVGLFALSDSRDRFSQQIRDYFAEWSDALRQIFGRADYPPEQAKALAEDILISIQGALVLARALDDPGCFEQVLDRLRMRFGLR